MQTIKTLMAEVAFLRETCTGQREDLAARDQTIADLQDKLAKSESITDDTANMHGRHVRSSIVTLLSNLASTFDGPERELVCTLVTQIQRGDDCSAL